MKLKLQRIGQVHSIPFETMWVEIKSSMAAELLLSFVMVYFTSITQCWYFAVNAWLLFALTMLRGMVLHKTFTEKSQVRRYRRVVTVSAISFVLCVFFVLLTMDMFISQDMEIGHKKNLLILMMAIVLVGLGVGDVRFTIGKIHMQILTYRYLTIAYIFGGAALTINAVLQLLVHQQLAIFQGITGLFFGIVSGVFCFYIWNKNLMRQEKNRLLFQHLFHNRLYIFTWISGKKDFVMVAMKVILGVMTMSGFMFANALYSGGMGIARHMALREKDSDYKTQIDGMMKVGATIVGASACYVIYTIRLLIRENSPQYPLEIALAIAAYTFFEFAWTMRDFFKTRKEHDVQAHEMKGINLASIMICFVMTQTAIMSTTYHGNPSFYNGLSGVLFGGLAVLLGIYMILYGSRLKKNAV